MSSKASGAPPRGKPSGVNVGSGHVSVGNKIKKLVKDSEFLLQVSFRNTLPNVPSGPFFRKVGIMHSHEEFARYNFSSLEKSYIWQPHFGPDLNTRLSLVDQEAILAEPSNESRKEIKKETTEYTSGTSSSGVDLRKKETRQKHWWLRETVYSENNILKNRSAGNDEGANYTSVDDVFDPFTVEAIEKSFEDVKTTVGSMDQVEWSVPIKPDLLLGNSHYAYISFDENPEAQNLSQNQSQADESSSTLGKRQRQSIVTNIRQSKSKKGSNNTYAVSIVSPPDENIDSSDMIAYQWTKDYRMIMKNKDWLDHVILVIDPSESAKYFSIGVNMEMDKLNIDEVDPHNATIVRKENDDDDSVDEDGPGKGADGTEESNEEPESQMATEGESEIVVGASPVE